MTALPRNVFGFPILSDSPVFLTVLFFHVIAAVVCVVTGMIAMLSEKRPGRHPKFGTLYYSCLGLVFVTATILAAIRWQEDAYLFSLGSRAFGAATVGRTARRGRWVSWVPTHIIGMGLSYTMMLIAFYMDNARNPPVWRNLPDVTYWLLPSAVGVPLIVRALVPGSAGKVKVPQPYSQTWLQWTALNGTSHP